MREVLTPFQITILRALAKNPLFTDFYLTGGTALSAFYLEHRFSDDLDLFTEIPHGVARAESEIQKVASALGVRVEWGKRFQTLQECTLVNPQGEKLEMDFALDMPGRLQPIHPGGAMGCGLDNKLDISCNKLSALYERSESKDYVDIYFILKEYYELEELWKSAQKKYPSLDLYGLTLAFHKVKTVEKLPRMIRALTVGDLKEFFLKKAEELSRDFDR